MAKKITDYLSGTERWDFSKNVAKPEDVNASSKELFHWICRVCNYPVCIAGKQWLAAPGNMVVKKQGCPNCQRRVLTPEYNLEAVYPNVAKQWHPTKNGSLTPKDYFPKSHEKAFWICPIHDFYEKEIALKASNPSSGCNKCNAKTSKAEIRIYTELNSLFPEVTNRKKHFGKEVDIFLTTENLAIEYDSDYTHRMRLPQDKIKNQVLVDNGINIIRVREKPLGLISPHDISVQNNTDLTKKDLNLLIGSIQIFVGQLDILSDYISEKSFISDDAYQEAILKINVPTYKDSIAFLYPKLVEEWDIGKNGPKTPEYFTPGSNQEINWKCSACKHCWVASIRNRAGRSSGCPNCAGKVLNKKNSLLELHPDIAAEFHPIENVGARLEDIFANSNDLIWWLCKNDNEHEWPAAVYNRTKQGGTGCPFCSKTVPSTTYNLKILYPDLAAQYDSQANQKPPSQELPGSNKLVSWKCNDCKNRWKARIKGRVKNYQKTGKLSGCRNCRGPQKPNQIKDSFAERHPILALQWDYQKNDRHPEEVKPTSRYKAHWACPHCKRAWSASVRGRVTSEASGKCRSCRKTGVP